jgi:hypothetical protein
MPVLVHRRHPAHALFGFERGRVIGNAPDQREPPLGDTLLLRIKAEDPDRAIIVRRRGEIDDEAARK